jgi:hypothetical protein
MFESHPDPDHQKDDWGLGMREAWEEISAAVWCESTAVE